MATWGFNCKNCGRSFSHEEIEDTLLNYLWPKKPALPAEGMLRTCPHCKAEFRYLTEDLVYQH